MSSFVLLRRHLEQMLKARHFLVTGASYRSHLSMLVVGTYLRYTFSSSPPFAVLSVSRPLPLQHAPLAFASGLAFPPTQFPPTGFARNASAPTDPRDKLVITYGVANTQARALVVSRRYLDSMFDWCGGDWHPQPLNDSVFKTIPAGNDELVGDEFTRASETGRSDGVEAGRDGDAADPSVAVNAEPTFDSGHAYLELFLTYGVAILISAYVLGAWILSRYQGRFGQAHGEQSGERVKAVVQSDGAVNSGAGAGTGVGAGAGAGADAVANGGGRARAEPDTGAGSDADCSDSPGLKSSNPSNLTAKVTNSSTMLKEKVAQPLRSCLRKGSSIAQSKQDGRHKRLHEEDDDDDDDDDGNDGSDRRAYQKTVGKVGKYAAAASSRGAVKSMGKQKRAGGGIDLDELELVPSSHTRTHSRYRGAAHGDGRGDDGQNGGDFDYFDDDDDGVLSDVGSVASKAASEALDEIKKAVDMAD
eukprot:6180646-Pleurochrysis_carterae.AAC.1